MDRVILKLLKPMLALLFVLAIGLPGLALAAADKPPERMTATVIEFAVRGGLNEQAGAIIADLMMSAIANTGRFTLKDRLPLSAAAKIAKAQEFGSTGLLDPKTAAELGRLYGVDAVVTGGVYKLGDLITVTARLIDTRTASLLRSGQIQGKDIDTIQIKVNELAAMITAPPPVAPTYALTVKTDPAGAGVRLLNSSTPYQPGIRLPSGNYEIEVTQPGYATRKEAVRIADRNVTLNIALEKAKYGLTIRSEPADAQIRLLNNPTIYQPGVQLAPGDYQIEVTRDGYASRKFPVRIVDSEVTVPVTLVKQEPAPPAQYRLTVQVDPPQAKVRLLNERTEYRPGMELKPGSYTVEVSQSGYETREVTVRIADSDVTVPVSLSRQPEPERPTLYRLTVRADPANARIRLLGIRPVYRPGIQLAPGSYTVEVGQSGYETKRMTVRIVDGDVTLPVALERKTTSVAPPSVSSAPPSVSSAPPSPPSRAGAWRIGSVRVDGWLSGADRSEVMRVLNGYVGRTVSRQTLLNGAMQVYRTTGMTLSFVVRNSASGSANLSARIAGRVRRTYESSVPLITPGQLENSGFGVSVE